MKSRTLPDGIMQFLNTYPEDGPRWQFLIIDFLETTCRLKSAGEPVTVPIDADNQILVHGKRYGERHWMH